MAAEHGTRWRYEMGCRCGPCTNAQRLYQRKYRERRANGTNLPYFREQAAVSPAPAAGPGRVELAVAEELEGLPQASTRPGLIETALALARVLDNAKVPSSQPAAARVLAGLLESLRAVPRGGGKLAVVRAMSGTDGA